MAGLSKVLARICIDCDIEFSCQDAKLGNLYTPQAYQLMKRMEFKSLLSRFQEKPREAGAMEEHFRLLEGKKAAYGVV